MQLLFSTPTYDYLKEELLTLGNLERGTVEVKNFPDGERYQRILSDVSGRDVVLIAGTVSDTDTLALYDLACAIEKYGAKSLCVVIPYFGYSTMERAVKSGEVVTAKTRARLLSSIPRTGTHNMFIFLDLHTEGLPHYLEGESRTIHVYCKEIVTDIAKSFGGESFILACTDAGRAKWVESLANDIGVQAAFVFKRRLSGEETSITGVSADVENQKVIIYDDMIRTGGSLIQAAKAYKEAGAAHIFAIATHGLFNNEALKRIQASDLFTKIACTNTHPNALVLENDFLKVASVAKVIHDRLMEQEIAW